MRSAALLLAALVAGLAACAVRPSAPAPGWAKAEATDADFRAAMAGCRTQASKQPLMPRLPSERSVEPGQPAVSLQDMANYKRAVDDCMAEQGWTRR